MRILVLTNSSGGLYHFRKELLLKLLEKNDVYVSCPCEENVDDLERLRFKLIDTPIDRRGINPIKDIKIVRKYMKIIRNLKPDMVITYTIKPNIYGGAVCRIMGIPYCCNITGLGTAFQSDNLLKKLVTVLYKFALKKVKTVFFENTGNRNIFVENKIIENSKTCVLAGAGVNTEEYSFAEYPSDKEIRFLFIGRVMKEKGIEEFCEAAERIKSEYADAVFDVVGAMEDDYTEYINEYVDRKIINYYGLQKDVKSFIRKAHCFVLPSYHEGMANTLLECGAMGRPLITSNIHGCLEAVNDGVTGYLCRVKDSDDLYAKIKQFVELPYEKKKEMGRLSHEYISKIFDKKEVVAKTVYNVMR